METSYIEFVQNSSVLHHNFQKSQEECLRLKERLDMMTRDNKDLEKKLDFARKLLDQEKSNTKAVERERDNLDMQIAQVKELFLRDRNTRRVIPEDTLEKLAFLDTIRIDNEEAPHLSCIPEVNSTGSILSNFSYSKSEDDLDISGKFHWKKHRPSTGAALEQPATKKRRSSGNRIVEISTNDTVRATTTLTMPKNGPITATSVIEAVPLAPSAPISNAYAPSAPPPDTPQSKESYKHFREAPGIPSDIVFQSWARSEGPPKPVRAKFERVDAKSRQESNNDIGYGQKQHVLQMKLIMMPNNCIVCHKKIGFTKSAWKCKDCKNVCHMECKDQLSTLCIPVVNTPNQGNGLGVISDYTGTIPPLVPPIIIHCINEIESRETKEVGLYRVPGSEMDVKNLKERFLRGKAAPCLNDVDVYVLCGVIKDFLRSLEPLVTKNLLKDFFRAAEHNNNQMLFQTISELPQSNRDTLAYIILHLQRISELKEVKMPADNLAKIFAPTLIGFTSENLKDKSEVITELMQQINVMKFLLATPPSYWESLIHVNQTQCGARLQQTPSTDSLLIRSTKTPMRLQGNTPKKRRFFPTPPDNRY
ncbi:hypothetical protein WA026_014579 [Henosepilachna vigintioctopunctata]|uniref:Rac GTPase-activating protein 1 n=1 Tax=Henosepilachna vigintioctopunctata TaxID=420089 RepID=A0AAW1VDW8_9CUCU